MSSTTTVSTYRALLKSLVRSGKHNRLQQLEQERKKQIAMLTYQRMQLVRDQQSFKGKSSLEQSKLIKQLNTVGKKIEELKKEDLSKSKQLLFYSHSGHLKEIVKSLKDDARSLEHLKDISAFVINQSEYEELIERYNPGLKMSQDEKVQRTANRVGLQVPE